MYRWMRPLALITLLALLALLAACGAADKSAPAADKARPQAPQPFAGLAIVADGPVSGMHFEHYGVNPTVETREAPSSRFGLNADRASYDLVRMQLAAGAVPAKASVRVEDFINAMPSPAAPPSSGQFALDAEAFLSPNRPGYHVLRLTLTAAKPAATDRRVIVVLDLSDPARVPQLREAVAQIVAQLGPTGRIGLIDIDGRILHAVGRADDPALRQALARLAPTRSTKVAGLEGAFSLALSGSGRPGQVIYCADGLVHRDRRTMDQLAQVAVRGARLGVGLTVLGVGRRQYDDARLARLALAAGGRYLYFDGATTAPDLITDAVIASGAYARVDFNPESVTRYRLLGHERHAERGGPQLRPGANVPAGSATTVLYEIKLAPGDRPLGAVHVESVDAQQRTASFDAPLPRAVVRATPSAHGRQALLAAAVAEKLRGAWWVRGVTYAQLRKQYIGLPAEMREPQLGALLEQAARVDRRGDPYAETLPLARMTFDHVPITRR